MFSTGPAQVTPSTDITHGHHRTVVPGSKHGIWQTGQIMPDFSSDPDETRQIFLDDKAELDGHQFATASFPSGRGAGEGNSSELHSVAHSSAGTSSQGFSSCPRSSHAPVSSDQLSGLLPQPLLALEGIGTQEDGFVPFDQLDFGELMTARKSFICPVCRLDCSDKGQLRRHYMIHTGEKPFACPYCPMRCVRKINLRYHIARVHQS